jgi:glycosyltransferase involved in cell wall biosynthesis
MTDRLTAQPRCWTRLTICACGWCRGLAAALNRGVSLARGRYIARQDHDDWAKPTRLKKQVAFMEANPDCALVGTCADGPSKSSLGRTNDVDRTAKLREFQKLILHRELFR